VVLAVFRGAWDPGLPPQLSSLIRPADNVNNSRRRFKWRQDTTKGPTRIPGEFRSIPDLILQNVRSLGRMDDTTMNSPACCASVKFVPVPRSNVLLLKSLARVEPGTTSFFE
jgi:hypothetical protein